MDAPDSRRSVKTAAKTFEILETIRDNDGMRLSELASELDVAKSTLHRYLQTLVDLEYLVTNGHRYHIGLRFLDLGEHARNRVQGSHLISRKVSDLAVETDERAQFIVEEHGSAVYLYRETGSNAVQTDPGIGKRIDLHSTAAGKAIMAEWPDDAVERFCERGGLPARTEQTITDPEVLMDEVRKIREQGYSVNTQENIDGLRAMGVPVSGQEGDVIGAFSVSGPLNRMKGEWFETELPDLLRGIANEIELNLRYS
ncbi:DNA-binding transcriptional regulator, IclR family [Halanaeroarchaeum sp. HSR-CO]|uniref:IclR family transcriptional regulator n=1 Tax=Halanaeroarchaeum sp. HSR-CO TaxID=2866382 RepID=UPI00217CEB4E|nr:IclR family transcriptional regulator [Halanaeroarchaeum sp. HSR-CO]UWG46365.1 DNA-binding transcriptional regulator, IclR family [Halanaeroarchaeum sp. HSR-CO]